MEKAASEFSVRHLKQKGGNLHRQMLPVVDSRSRNPALFEALSVDPAGVPEERKLCILPRQFFHPQQSDQVLPSSICADILPTRFALPGQAVLKAPRDGLPAVRFASYGAPAPIAHELMSSAEWPWSGSWYRV